MTERVEAVRRAQEAVAAAQRESVPRVDPDAGYEAFARAFEESDRAVEKLFAAMKELRQKITKDE